MPKKNADNMKRYIFLFSRLERNDHGKWEFVAYYKVV